MRLLVHSTAPWSNSSYSILVTRTVPNIVRDGHHVTLSTWYGLQGQPLPWQIQPKDGKPGGVVNVMPTLDGAGYARDTIVPAYQYFRADCLITISDVWVFPKEITGQCNFAAWLPVDHDPTPKPILDSLEPCIYPMVYSKWGVDVLAKDGVRAHYVPGSAPADLFKPGDKAEARKALHFPEKADFVVSMVSANKDPLDRKGFAEGLAGFARFAEKHEGAMLYLHTNWGGAIDLKSLAMSLGIQDKMIMPDPFGLAMGMLNDDYMAQVYQASDVLLNPCKSEGFGLPLVEAQMCGCPIAVTDFATTDELLFAGWKIQGQADWSNGLNSWRIRVYIDSVVDALEEAYRNRDNPKLAQKARNGAMRFDNDTVFNQYWRPALRDIEAIVSKAKVAMPKIPAMNGKVAEYVEEWEEVETMVVGRPDL